MQYRALRGSVFAGMLAVVLPVGAAEPLTDSERHVEHAGSIVRYALPASALLATFMVEPRAPDDDAGASWWLMGGSPRHDLLLGLGRAWVATGALKHTVDETRPDGGRHSFPSGHTSMAFAGAEFIRKEYGWQWGAPALLAAGFVGWSRVDAKRHHPHDVLAGAAIGVLANHDFWRRETRAGRFALAPALLSGPAGATPGIGFEWRLKNP